MRHPTHNPLARPRRIRMAEKKDSGLKKFFKMLGIIAVVLLLIVVVGFGLLVGFCALGGR